jgi:hypothetical protein
MSSDKFSAPVGHPCTPDATNINFGLIAEKMQRYPKVDRPG